MRVLYRGINAIDLRGSTVADYLVNIEAFFRARRPLAALASGDLQRHRLRRHLVHEQAGPRAWLNSRLGERLLAPPPHGLGTEPTSTW